MKKLYVVSLWILNSEWSTPSGCWPGKERGVLEFSLEAASYVAESIEKMHKSLSVWEDTRRLRIRRESIFEVPDDMVRRALSNPSSSERLFAVALLGLRIGHSSFEVQLESSAMMAASASVARGKAALEAAKRWPAQDWQIRFEASEIPSALLHIAGERLRQPV